MYDVGANVILERGHMTACGWGDLLMPTKCANSSKMEMGKAEKERAGERQTDRQTERDRDTERQRETETERHRERVRGSIA